MRRCQIHETERRGKTVRAPFLDELAVALKWGYYRNMSATEVMTAIDQLPVNEQEEVFTLLTRKIIARRDPAAKPCIGKKLTFDEACEVVFRENRELLGLLAK